MDEKIKTTVKRVVEEEGQPKELADKILAWFESVSNGSESIIEDRDRISQRSELCLNAVIIKIKD